MSEFSGYANKATAVRGLGRFLGVLSRNNPDLDVNSLIEQRDGKWGFDHAKANAAVGIAPEMSEEDADYVANYGHVNCPSCGIHLSNGVSDFDGMVERHGSERAAFKHQKTEWACLGCGADFGKAIELKPTSSGNKTGRTYPNRAKSDVEKPSEIVFRLADAEPEGARKDIVAKAVAEGVTINTANAAYQHWRKARGLTKARG